MNSLRMLNTLKLSAASPLKRGFQTSAIRNIKAGEAFPDAELVEDSPGNKINLSSALKKHDKAIVVGVPAAFSPACSSTHIPGYIKAASPLPVYVVSVNDPFVMKAWGDSLAASTGTAPQNIRYLGDPAGELTRKLNMEFESAKIFGNNRSKRYALVVEKGVVTKVAEEPDNTGVKVSRAEEVLKGL
ncbi:Redoxin [Ascodesmis nigricans]|uniref:Redoxin n=1 Tax=Ascodesmis nigricans TaxID=341454 RepID=A0A4S2MXB5_9PEZI|nr:Redoxin [Ascodesmis nigricans]